MGTPYQGMVSPPQAPLQYSTSGGLGLLDGYVIDSRLSEKGREIRLLRTLLETRNIPDIGVPKGFGIDENTAFFVSNPFTRPIGKVIGLIFNVPRPIGISYFQVVTADVSVSGILFTDVSKIASKEILEASYRNVPISFYTVNDTVELPSGINRKLKHYARVNIRYFYRKRNFRTLEGADRRRRVVRRRYSIIRYIIPPESFRMAQDGASTHRLQRVECYEFLNGFPAAESQSAHGSHSGRWLRCRHSR